MLGGAERYQILLPAPPLARGGSEQVSASEHRLFFAHCRTSCACQFGTKLEAWNSYRSHSSLADVPFQEGLEALHLVLSARVASLRRTISPCLSSLGCFSVLELLRLFLMYAVWAGDRVKHGSWTSLLVLDTHSAAVQRSTVYVLQISPLCVRGLFFCLLARRS